MALIRVGGNKSAGNLSLGAPSNENVSLGSHTITVEDGAWYLLVCLTSSPTVRGVNNFSGYKNLSTQPATDASPKYFMFQADGTSFGYDVYGYAIDGLEPMKISPT